MLLRRHSEIAQKMKLKQFALVSLQCHVQVSAHFWISITLPAILREQLFLVSRARNSLPSQVTPRFAQGPSKCARWRLHMLGQELTEDGEQPRPQCFPNS